MSSRNSSEKKYKKKSNNYTQKNLPKLDISDISLPKPTPHDIPYISSEKELFEFIDNLPPDLSFQKPIINDWIQPPPELNYSIYNNLDRQSIINTFFYMFYHIRIGIFVHIKTNRLVHFVPFQNPDYTNNWDESLLPPFKNSKDIEKYYLNKKKNYPNNRDSNINDIETNLNKWSANNCIIGNWNKEAVGTGAWYELKEMIESACMTHRLNDCIFFINRRDHPILTGNGTEESYRKEPYFHIFNNLTTPLSRNSYDNYVPILSFSKNDNFADLLIPNYEDWNYIKELENSVFHTYIQFHDSEQNQKKAIEKFKMSNPNASKKLNKALKIKIIKDFYLKMWNEDLTFGRIKSWVEGHFEPNRWNKKKDIAVFRGSSSGCGTNPQNNQRLRLGRISQIEGMNDILDVGILGINIRDKKFMNSNVNYYDYKLYKLPKKNRMTFNEQCNYKYIIHVDGHVSAYRLGKELSSNSVILKVDSLFDYKLWFSNYLVENYHYLPIKKDLSNLKSAIVACKENDETCKKIGENAHQLFNSIINRKYVSAYFSNLINSISNNYII